MVHLGMAGPLSAAMRTTFKQLIRYGVVGVASNLIGYFLYLWITVAGLEPKFAMTTLYAVGVVQTFAFNKGWSFGYEGAHRAAFLRYCSVYVLGYLINLLALFVCVDLLDWAHQLVQAIMICVVAVLLFLLQKFWVFGSY